MVIDIPSAANASFKEFGGLGQHYAGAVPPTTRTTAAKMDSIFRAVIMGCQLSSSILQAVGTRDIHEFLLSYDIKCIVIY